MSGGGAGRHEFVAHTAELALRLDAPSFEGLLAAAVEGLGEELVKEVGELGPGEARVLEVAAPDREAALVDLLNEVLYVAETAAWAPTVVERVVASGGRARVRAIGVRLAAPPARIKAATFHGLAVRPTPHGLSAEVILDV